MGLFFKDVRRRAKFESFSAPAGSLPKNQKLDSIVARVGPATDACLKRLLRLGLLMRDTEPER